MLIALLAVFGLTFMAAMPAVVSAQTDASQESLCQGVLLDSDGSCSDIVDSDAEVQGLAEKVIDIFSLIVGIVSVVVIIFAGLRYIVSGGESGNVTNARNTILYAVVGLVIVIFAQTIVKFVVSKFTS